MKKVLAIADYTIKDNIRHKIFYTLLLFGVVILISSLVFSLLSPEEETRVILDVGLGVIEIFAFLSAIFAGVGLILGEIENRSIALILARPIKRLQYIWGRYLGILSVSFINVLSMSVGLLVLLWLKGWTFQSRFILAIVFVFFKVVVISSLAILFSLISTSAISSMSMTFLVWVLGHITEHLKYLNHILLEKGIKITFLLKAIYYLLPNFQYLSVKDYLGYPHPLPAVTTLCQVTYSVAYASAVICLAVLVFSRKEL